MALFGFDFGALVGVDVEIIRPIDHMDAIANRFFSPLENEMLYQASPVEGNGARMVRRMLSAMKRLWCLSKMEASGAVSFPALSAS